MKPGTNSARRSSRHSQTPLVGGVFTSGRKRSLVRNSCGQTYVRCDERGLTRRCSEPRAGLRLTFCAFAIRALASWHLASGSRSLILCLVRSMRRVLISVFAFTAIATAEEPRLSPKLEAHLHAQKTGVCELHHVPMDDRVVQVSYGLPMRDDKYVAAMGRAFPNAEDDVNGGCDPSAGLRKAHIFVCPECKRAQLRWARRHPKNWEAQIILRGKT